MIPEDFVRVFQSYAQPENAQAMSAYMKHQFPFFGIKTPLRRILFRQIIATQSIPDEIEALKALCYNLYKLPQRELHYVALELTLKKQKLWTANELPFFEYLITHNSWWDSVDFIAPKIVGPWFKTNPKIIEPTVHRWIESENIWLQRSALLFQLKYKQSTDTVLMEEVILSLRDNREFFIQKAIGWLLREYAKTNPQYVMEFTSKHPLSPLSQREALKHLSA